MRHLCHAEGCTTPVRPSLFACARHWRMVPADLKAALLAAYKPGQEAGRAEVTPAYLIAQTRCRIAIATAEGRDLGRLQRALETFERLAVLRTQQEQR